MDGHYQILAMQQHYYSNLLTVVLALLLSPALFAATITVTTTADTGAGSLRQAVMMARAGDTIVFSSATDGQSVQLMSVINIRKNLTITGNGRKVTMLDGNAMSRAFSVLDGATVMISDLMIKNGRETIGGGLRVRAGATLTLDGVQVDNCVATGARSNLGGGAVYNQGTLYVMNSVLSNNTALGRQGSGGAIFNAPGGTLDVSYSRIRHNQANRAGGGIEDASGSGTMVTITETTINDNIVYNAPGNGGGIHIGSDGDLMITGGTVDMNQAGAEGGGIWNGAGTLTVSNTLVRMNVAMGDEADQGGGGLYNNGNGTIILMDNARILDNKATGTSGSGGGILNNTGATLTITDSKINGNEANRAGGGIEDASGSGSMFTITNSFVNKNVVYDAPGNGGGIHIGGDGSLTVDGGRVNENTAGAEGGGIWNNTGTLTLKGNASIFGNVAMGDAADQGGGGLYNNGGGTIVLSEDVQVLENKATGTAGSGGGILNNTDATLMIYDSRIAGNEANRAGGGIEDASGSGSEFTIMNTKITDNVVYDAPGNGGGIHIGGDGSLSITGGFVNDNSAGAEGGGIWNNTGTLTVSGTNFRGNVAMGDEADQGGGALYNNGGGTITLSDNVMIESNKATGMAGSGGGILNNVGATLEISNSRIVHNEANRAGGGIEDASGSGSMFTITDSRINENIVYNAPGNGGGIHIGSDGDLMITGSTVDMNQAGAEGGGIWNGAGTLTVSNTLVRENVAMGDAADQGGGGLYNNGSGTIVLMDNARILNNKATGTSGSGGGILNNTGATLTITDSKINGNEANRAGGGIEDASGSGSMFTITNSFVNKNVVYDAPGNGGGIHIGGDGSLTVDGGRVSENRAGAEGGGIWNNTGTLTVKGNASIFGNVAMGDEADQGGGGLYNNGGGTIVLSENVEVLENKATGTSGSGGGILNNTGATLTIMDSRIAYNEANRAGGGIEDASGSGSMVEITNTDFEYNRVNFAPGNGGAVHVGGDGDLMITGGMVSNNSAGQEGGGLWNSVGTMTVYGVEFHDNVAEGNKADDGGGALFNNGGTLIVEDAYVHANLATGTSGSGGGLFSTGGSVTVTGGEFADNTSMRAGGAVEIVDGSYTSMDVTYDGNMTGSAPGNGGAFHVTGMMSTVDFTGGYVTNNVAANEGGGIWNQSGTMMTITGVSILGNTVTNNGSLETRVAGAGVFNNGGILDIMSSTIANNAVTGRGPVGGGGIANNTGGTLTVMQSTVSGNQGGVTGGGIANDGTVEIVNTTITDNTALAGGGYAQATPYAVLTITGTIVADNEAIKAPDFASAFSTVNSGGYNLIGEDALNQFPATDTDKEGMSADLMPLADNGGMTMTHEPRCSSPAIDMGNPDDNMPDQIGQPVFGGIRDIGSFEKQSACPTSEPMDPMMMKYSKEEDNQVQPTGALSVFPNPVADDFLNVMLPRHFEGEVTLRVISSDGRSREVRTAQTAKYRLDLSSFGVGAYMLQVTDGAEVQTTRFVITR